eukprot:scaffold470328_cov32-Prasinocladus_malaysianus.AAC.1
MQQVFPIKWHWNDKVDMHRQPAPPTPESQDIDMQLKSYTLNIVIEHSHRHHAQIMPPVKRVKSIPDCTSSSLSTSPWFT